MAKERDLDLTVVLGAFCIFELFINCTVHFMMQFRIRVRLNTRIRVRFGTRIRIRDSTAQSINL